MAVVERWRVTVRGVVQGVGFRPFVFRLADSLALTGWVLNNSESVVVEVQGQSDTLCEFVRALVHDKPAVSEINSVDSVCVDLVEAESGFVIRQSELTGDHAMVIPTDLRLCELCLAELNDPSNRRYQHPFINCIHCGPRYSIVEQVPYDRPNTSMRNFTMCEQCEREYRDPMNRRYHAQPIACPECGPRLLLRGQSGEIVQKGNLALDFAATLLAEGKILALKGIGGFQLIVDASSDEAIMRLREKKRRPEKPFAVMFRTLDELKTFAEVTEEEARLLGSCRAPIVLVKKAGRYQLPESIAPQNLYLGAMLPTSALHELLLGKLGRAIVCTSGNLSEEPICYTDEQAFERLKTIADGYLIHDRPICRSVDDSVVRVDSGRPTLLRRARGWAPGSTPINRRGPTILAVGGQEKNTIAYFCNKQLIVSQHLGSMNSEQGVDLFHETVRDYVRFFEHTPEIIVSDKHPDYATTTIAESLASTYGAKYISVQHHHAHALACAFENNLHGPFLALTWDGTGYGDDGTIWGGEALVVEGTTFQRVGHLLPFALPGGEKAVKEPRRSALGVLNEVAPQTLIPEVFQWFSVEELRALQSMLSANVGCPRTTSLGRLFDAVSALLGIRWQRGFEGQAAMALEFAATGVSSSLRFGWEYYEESGVLVADIRTMVSELLAAKKSGVDRGELALGFHESLADLAFRWAEHAKQKNVVLSGGCFQNAVLVRVVEQRLRVAEYQVFVHKEYPCNDGSISLGQMVYALGVSDQSC